jgi:hypothetical protein
MTANALLTTVIQPVFCRLSQGSSIVDFNENSLPGLWAWAQRGKKRAS